METNNVVPNFGFLNLDDTLKLDGNTYGSFQADSWDMQQDSVHNPSFSPDKNNSSSSLGATTIENWSALGSNLAGTD